MAVPSRRKVEEEEFGHTSTYNIGRTQSQHAVLQRVRQELFSPNILNSTCPITNN